MNESESQELITADSGTVALLNKSEIDMQIATAHKYPRSVKRFRDETLAMVTLNEKVAQECIYSLPRRELDKVSGEWVTKTIEGPSARFAEVVASAWGNSRAGSRVVSDEGDFVTAQGVFHDLERNVAITYEVQRRITDSKGKRYKPDMIGVTANAACSIALRNAILKGVPKAFWSDMYDEARQTAIGNVMTLVDRRSRALKTLQKYGVQPAQVFAFLRIGGEPDITLEHLATLFGITTALKEGDTTPEQAFAIDTGEGGAGKPAVKMPTAKVKEPEPNKQHTESVDQGTGEITSATNGAEGETQAVKSETARPQSGTPAGNPETGKAALASKGEQAFVRNRCKSHSLDLAEVLATAGAASLETMTTDQFIAIKDQLPKSV